MATTKTSKKTTTMADLLKSAAKTSFVGLKKGDNIEGVITKLTPKEILIDIGAKTEAVVLEKDRKNLKNLLSSLKIGDKVLVYVLNPESDLGNPVVSLRKYMDDILWKKLAEYQKNKSIVKVVVNDSTKGGFLVTAKNSFSAFLPNSQVSFTKTGQEIIGKEIEVLVLELNRQSQKIILSNKAIGGSDDFEKEVRNLKIEQKISTIVSNITPFGIFTLIKGKEGEIEGFIHISEISWDKISQIPKEYKAGEEIEALITGFDKKTTRVNLSIKRLSKDPLSEKLDQLEIDKKIIGKVIKVLATGFIVELEDGIEGIIKKEKIPPNTTLAVGSTVTATISDVDKKKHRVSLVPILKEKPIGYR